MLASDFGSPYTVLLVIIGANNSPLYVHCVYSWQHVDWPCANIFKHPFASHSFVLLFQLHVVIL